MTLSNPTSLGEIKAFGDSAFLLLNDQHRIGFMVKHTPSECSWTITLEEAKLPNPDHKADSYSLLATWRASSHEELMALAREGGTSLRRWLSEKGVESELTYEALQIYVFLYNLSHLPARIQ